MTELVANGNFDSPDITTAADAGIAITNWTKSWTNIGLLDMIISGYTRVGLPSSITQTVFLFQATADIRSLTQSITFPIAGNYVLTFYAYADSLNTNQFQASIGSTILQSILFPASGVWYKYVVPFTISNTQLTQTLKFQTIQNNGEGSIQRFGGVSIVAAAGVSLVKNGYMFGTNGSPTLDGWTRTDGYVRALTNPASNFYYGIDSNNNNSSRIYQNVVFPADGNYLLTYWVRPNLAVNTNTLTMTLGSVISNTIDYVANTPVGNWVQYQYPFYIKTPSTLLLNFLQGPTPLFAEVFCLTGVSIVSTDYTLDLYLEWIPDEDVKKNNQLY